jgi:hypothetical protein
MGYLRGLSKAVLIYLSIAGALLLTLGLEFGVFIAGLLTGHISGPTSTNGAWLPIFLLSLFTMVFLQPRLPRRIKDALHLHQLSLNGAQATIEQLFVRASLLVAYITVAMTQVLSIESMLALETLTATCFLIFLPAVQATVARGRYSLIDYVLLARAAPFSPQHSRNVDHRDGQVVLSLAAAALTAFVAANLVKDSSLLNNLSSWRNSNPALFTAILSGAYDLEDTTKEPHEITSPEVKSRIESALAAVGTKVVDVRASGPATLEAEAGANPISIDVDDSIDVQVALPALSSARIKIAFQEAADQVCKAELQARPDSKSLAVNMLVFGQFDAYLFEVRKPFVCSDVQPAKGASGSLIFNFGLSMTSSATH